MFDKLIKRKSKNQEEDDFFKEEKKSETSLVEEEEGEEVTKEQLAEDLEAFKDDLRKSKSKPLIDAEPVDTESENEELDIEEEQEEKSTKTKPLEIKSEDTETEWSMKKKSNNNNDDDGWLNKDYEEGELAVDVYQDKDNVYVRSTIAGVSSDDIDISIHNDLLTIRGKREKTKDMQGVDYFYQECYWGSFSRSIILPVEVKADKIDAFLKDGILTIVLPKVKKASTPKIKVKEK